MAENIAQYMSYDDWKELGPLNRSAPNENEIYDGTTREAPNTPYWAHLNVGGVNKVLGNPNHNYQADAFSSEHNQVFHFMNTLSQGGKEGLKLIREAAKEGDRVTADANRIGGNDNAWTAVGPDAGSAHAIRELVSTALEFYPPAKGVLSQQLPKKPEDVDFDDFAARFAERATPKRFRARHLDNGKMEFGRSADGKSQSFGGLVGVFADKGLEGKAVDWMGTQSPKLAFAPGKDAHLWKAIIESKSTTHRREKMYDGKSNQSGAADQVIEKADAITVFWDGDERSAGSRVIAAAARAGKLAKVCDAHGEEMPLFETANEAMMAHMSKKEFARSKTLDAFSVPASDPVGRLGLSLIRSEKEGRLSDKDINRLAMSGETINYFADMAETENGKEALRDEFRLTSNSIKLLGNEGVMANARSSFLRINKHLSENNVEVVGPEDFPKGLLASGQMPAYMFVQGPKEVLRNAENIVGVIGEGATEGVEQRMTASRTAPAISGLASTKATIARVEGQTSVEVPVNGPQILLIDSGHAHASRENSLKDRANVLDAGGVVVSLLPPEETSSFYDRTSKERVGIESTGNEITTRHAASLMGAMSETVLVTEMDASKTNSATHAAVLSGLTSGRRPTVVNYNDAEGFQAVSGNRALTMARGSKALERAGYGANVIEGLGKELEGSRISIDTGSDIRKAMPKLVDLMAAGGLNPSPAARDDQSRSGESR
jgi:hypothetical protein